MSEAAVDLKLDLNSEDDAGLPWGFVDEAADPSRLHEGAWIVDGSGRALAEAQVADIDGDIVHVRPYPVLPSATATCSITTWREARGARQQSGQRCRVPARSRTLEWSLGRAEGSSIESGVHRAPQLSMQLSQKS